MFLKVISYILWIPVTLLDTNRTCNVLQIAKICKYFLKFKLLDLSNVVCILKSQIATQPSCRMETTDKNAERTRDRSPGSGKIRTLFLLCTFSNWSCSTY